MKKIIFILCVLIITGGNLIAQKSLTDTTGSKTVGYFPSWHGNVSEIQFDKLTHINYSFLLPNHDGSLQPVENTYKLQSLVTKAHENGVKVSIAVGGWNDGDDSAFESISESTDKCKTFTHNLMDFIREYSLDGVDIDWEYPSPQTSGGYVNMMYILSDSLHNSGKLLTTAVAGTVWNEVDYPDSVFNAVDWINIMAYDNFDEQNHSTFSYAESCLHYWLDIRNVPPVKAALGVPFYGYSPYKGYNQIVYQYPEAPYTDHVGTYYYNGKNTIHKKTQLAVERGCGIMIWEIAQDTHDDETSLLTVIYDTFNGTYGIAEKKYFNIEIYPDPAQDYININFPEERVFDFGKIIDGQGKTIEIFELENNPQKINIGDFKPGIYLIMFRGIKNRATVKFIKK